MSYQINKNGVDEDVGGFRGKKNAEYSMEILRRRDLAEGLKWRIILKYIRREWHKEDVSLINLVQVSV